MKYYNLGILFIFLSLIVILTSYYYTGLTRPLEKEIEVIQLKINSAEKQIKINELEFAAHLNHEYLKKLESVYFSNTSTGTILCNAAMSDSSASNYDAEFWRDEIAGTTAINFAPEGLNLEAGDAIKVQAASASYIKVLVNYALINRENENG